jgi:hydrogenase expression/formation protein HypC
MKNLTIFRVAGDRDGGAFRAAHVIRRRPSAAPAHGLPCMASRLRQRGAVLRETLPTPFFTSLRGTPHHPDQLMVLPIFGCKAQAHPARDGRYPDPVGKGGAGYLLSMARTEENRMCLALPVKVIEVGAGDTAIVDLGGVRKEISLALLSDVQVGDYVILHVGYALSKLDPEEAEKTLALFAEMNADAAGTAAA